MPSYILALREGFRMGIQRAKTEQEILAIEENPENFITELLKVKTGPVTLPNGEVAERIPQTDFWFVEGNEFIGEIGIRHTLNAFLLNLGGHIGYGIRPSIQGKGYATEMVKASLDFCRNELNLDKVLLTVEETNLPSIKVIEKCGGILENKINRSYDNAVARRYWITL